MLGDDGYSAAQLARFPPVWQPLVRVHPGSQRKVIFPSVHADQVSDMSVPEGRLLLMELLEHATQPQFYPTHGGRGTTSCGTTGAYCIAGGGMT